MRDSRLRLGMTQEQLAEKTGLAANYIARVERGEAFPRLENLINIMNALGVSADAIFCDVVDHSANYPISALGAELDSLPASEKQRILEVLRLMVDQAKGQN